MKEDESALLVYLLLIYGIDSRFPHNVPEQVGRDRGLGGEPG